MFRIRNDETPPVSCFLWKFQIGQFRVYLPTLLSARKCYEIPLVVGYTCVAVGKVGHFTALVGVKGELRHLPLVDEHGEDLPVR